ncbi:MAG: hypothetical protein MJZ94_04945 [Bacteroidales bacterium]|nr:hypothetical protein [Bacteroidales bacterium]
MKKLFLSMGLACLFMVACNNAPKQEAVEETIDTVAVVEEVVEEHVCPMAQLKGEFDNWANLDAEAQAALVGKAIEMFGQEQESCCNHEGEEGQECEMTEEQKAEMEAVMAKMNDWKAQFANIATMSLEEQKDLIMARFDLMKSCCKQAAEEAVEAAAETIQEVVE